MDRRQFLAGSAAAAVVAPSLAAGTITETYANCPARFALRSWQGDDGLSYRMVVRLPRYIEGSRDCQWTKQAHSKEPKT